MNRKPDKIINTENTSYSIFIYDHKVALTDSILKTGINKHSKKPYQRWARGNFRGFYRNSNGLVIPYHVSKYRGGFTSSQSLLSSIHRSIINTQDYNPYFTDAVKSKLKITTLEDIYPMLTYYTTVDRDAYFDVPQHILFSLRQTTAKDFTYSLFGTKNYRRDLVKAVAQSQLQEISIVRDFKNLVPVDWIINFLREIEVPADRYRGAPSSIRTILRQLDPRSYRQLLRDTNNYNFTLIRDISRATTTRGYRRLLQEEGHYYVRSFRELHDTIYGRQYHEPIPVEPPKNRKIKLTGLSEKLDGHEFDGLVFKPAKNTDQMYSWSEEMHNCISIYADNAIHGQGYYIGVEKDNKLIANMEIKHGALTQLLGKYNNVLDDDTKSKILTVLHDHYVDTTENWWGK